MQLSDKAKLLIEKLESITGKKVLVEFIGDVPSAAQSVTSNQLSNRQIGAQKALKTKGFEEWNEHQYALAYFIALIGKNNLPAPYNKLTMEQIADDADVKRSTLALCIERARYMITGGAEGLATGGPKIENFLSKFSNLDKNTLAELAMDAFAGPAKIKNKDNPHSVANKYKHADIARGRKANPIEQERLERLNKNRVAAGQPRFIRQDDGTLVMESIKKRKSFIVENANNFNTDNNVINKILSKADGDRNKAILLANNVASKITNTDELLNNFNAANSMGKSEIADIFYNKADKLLSENVVNNAINKLTEIVGKNVVLEGVTKNINRVELNEWFAANGYDKLLSLLDKAIKTANALRGYSIFYPEDWKGNETAEVEKRIKNVYNNMVNSIKGINTPIEQKKINGGTPSFVDKAINKVKNFANRDATENKDQKPANPKIHKFATESENKENKQALNEWFAMTTYKKLLNILDKCAKQAEQIGNFKNKDLQIDPKVILSKLKQVWKLFHAGNTSGDNKSFAADPINKLSAKGINVPNSGIANAPNTKTGIGQKIKDLGNKTVDKIKNFANRDATENKDQKPANPKTHKFAMESKELNENANMESCFSKYREKNIKPISEIKKGKCFITLNTGSEFCISDILQDGGKTIIVTKFADGPYKGEYKDLGTDFINKIGHSFIPIEEMRSELEEDNKPSAGLDKKQKSRIVKKAESGKNIGHGNFDKVEKKAEKEYDSKEEGEKVAAAAMWKNKAKNVHKEAIDPIESVDKINLYDVKLSNGKIFNNVKFKDTNSFVTEDGNLLINQDIAFTRKK